MRKRYLLALECVYVCGHPFGCLEIPSTLERLQSRGHRLGTIASNPVHALGCYRAVGAALPSLVDCHRTLLTHSARCFPRRRSEENPHVLRAWRDVVTRGLFSLSRLQGFYLGDQRATMIGFECSINLI